MKKYFFLSIPVLILSVLIYLILFEIEYIPIIELDDSYNAKCLDGSNYRFNFIQGKGEGKNKFFLYLEGGGWCGQETLGDNFVQSCFQRASTSLGSKIGFLNSLVISRLVRLLSSKEKYNQYLFVIVMDQVLYQIEHMKKMGLKYICMAKIIYWVC